MIDFVKLPSGWSIEEIEELCIFNPKHDREIDNNIEVSFVPMATVDEHAGVIKSQERKLLGEVRKGYTHFANDDIIFAKITPCMENGKVAVACNLINGLACGSTEFHVLRSYGGILPNYLFYFLRQQSYLNMAAGNMTGVVGQRRLPKEFLLTTKVPIPPLNEQRRLVTKIEALKTRSQRVKDALSSIPALLDQFRQSVLAAAFSGALTADWRQKNPDVEPAEVLLEKIRLERKIKYEEDCKKASIEGKKKPRKPENIEPNIYYNNNTVIPDSWFWSSFADIASTKQYSMSSGPFGSALGVKDYKETGIPVIRGQNIQQGKFVLKNFVYISEEKALELIRSSASPGDIIIVAVGSSGQAAIVPKELKYAILSQNCNKFTVDETWIDASFILMLLQNTIVKSQMQEKTTDTVRQFLSLTNLKSTLLPVPPLEEQKEIVHQIKLLFKVADTIEQQYQQTKDAINQLDQSILAEAFRGALVPQDPNDEPASVLLERIRAEREKSTGATFKRSKKSADTSPSQNNKNTGATSKRSNKDEPFKEAIQMELELE